MVWTLEELLFTEDQNTLAGHISALLGQFDAADDFFCRSSYPINALNVTNYSRFYKKKFICKLLLFVDAS